MRGRSYSYLFCKRSRGRFMSRFIKLLKNRILRNKLLLVYNRYICDSGIFDNLLDGRNSAINRSKAVLAKGGHAEFYRFLPDENRRGSIVDQVTQRVSDFQEFVDSFASLIARMVARVAPLPVIEVLVANVVRCEPKRTKDRLRRLVGRAALRADFPNETLSEHALQGSRNQKWLDAHIDQAGHSAGRVVCVQGGENEMPGE